MAHGKVYCSSGGGTAKRRARCTEHRAVHMVSYTCCGSSNSHTVSGRGGNCECKAPCTCESKSGDAHTGEGMGNETVPDNTCHRYHDMRGRTLADAHKGSDIRAPLHVFRKSKHLPGCGRTLVSRLPSPCTYWCTVAHTVNHTGVHREAASGKAPGK